MHIACLLTVALATLSPIEHLLANEFTAGVHAVDISPRTLPAIRNGSFLEQTADTLDDPLHARCLALFDGRTTIAIAIVDSCMIPRDVCDAIKREAEKGCGIPANRILVAATHTHSAPSMMDYCLGSRKDTTYTEFAIPRIASGIVRAHAQLQPAKAGWAVADAPKHTNCRRWIHAPNSFENDPFGEKTVRAMMHPGYRNPAYLCPSGPVDTKLTLLSIRSADDRPIAVLANYSMHYFGGTQGFSAEYFGDFARYLEEKVAGDANSDPPFIGIMSQGTSGDLHYMNYHEPPRPDYKRRQYAHELGDIALQALKDVKYRSDIDLAMAETTLPLKRRLPSTARLEWAAEINKNRGDLRPRNLPEVYAEQAVWLNENPSTELLLQAVRIGELGITAIPNEVFAITGLKLKAQSPIQPLMNIELANGAEGYIPPPEQHYLGGYTTWPARTAGLETEAEPKIVAALLRLLEEVSAGAKRRPLTETFYTPQQTAAMDQARHDNNNRENRGAAVVSPN
jgi:hypothetical protein